MSRNLFYVIFICLLSFFQRASAQDCELPQTFSGNTGSNMTVFLTSGAIDALPVSSNSPYIVAFSPDGVLVGSVSIASADLQGGQAQMAVWGDDTATPETDGALAGDELSFQLVDESSLYDLNLIFNGSNSYVSNGVLPVLGASASLNCEGEEDTNCVLPQQDVINTGANMTVFLTSGAIDALPVSSTSPFIVAISPSGITVGYVSVASADLQGGQAQMAVFGDDTQTPETDGALAGDELSFQLIDGSSLYDLNLIFNGSNSYVSNGVLPVLGASAQLNCSVPSSGCTDNSACNYNESATIDDGSCYNNDLGCGCDLPAADIGYDCDGNCLSDTDNDGVCDEFEIEGCQDVLALNYDSEASDQGSCDYLGCLDSLYFEYNPNATISNGSCYTEIISGCLDASANNYNPNANTYDGSCTFDSGLNHILVSNPLDGFTYASGSDIIINYEFISDDINLGYTFQFQDFPPAPGGALIRYSLDEGGYVTISPNQIGEVNLGQLSDGNHTLEITLYSNNESPLIPWNPLVQTTVSFLIGPAGCTDEIACNYDSLAVVHDYSCIYPALYYDCFDACNSDIDNDGVCDELEILGCQDSTAFNFDSSATDAGFCEFLGCTDILYLEYDPLANTDNGSCQTLVVEGCMNQNSFNYDSLANVDDASCYDFVNGCMDTLAFNFNDYDFDGYPNELTGINGIDVNNAIDDCDFYGCMEPNAENYDPLANINAVSIDSLLTNPCTYMLIPGCMNDTACNYEEDAEVDDGSCLFDDICGDCGGAGPNEGYNCDGTCITDTDSDGVCDEFEVVGCIDALAVNFNSLATDAGSCDYLGCTDSLYLEYNSIATIDDSTCVTFIILGCTDQDYLEYSDAANVDNGSCLTIVVPGCTDLLALNYDETANEDDGSCYVFGCLDPFAQNTDTLANIDDGSCTYESVVDSVGNSDEDCEIPIPTSINTGANMTVMLTPAVMSSLPDDLDEDAYVVAIANNSGLILGSASVYDVEQTSIAIWGDDSSTPDIDGAEAGEIIYFQLVNGHELFDVEITLTTGTDLSYTTNAVTVAITSSVSLNCSSGGGFVETCEIPSESLLNTGANMTVMLTSGVMSSFPDNLDEDAYVVAISNNSGLIVGSVSVYDVEQTSIAVWGDDSSTPDVDGAVAGEIILYQLVNGNDLYDIEFTQWLSGNGSSYVTNSINISSNVSVILNCNSSGGGTLIIGCMHIIACNYDSLATSPSSCTYSDSGYDCDNNCIIDTDADGVCDEFEVEGCVDPFADNYNYLATDSVTCNYLGCMDTLYVEYDSIATINEGCENLITYGCMDSFADNYNPDANFSNGSCTFENISNPYIEVLFNSNIPVDGYLEEEGIFIEYIFHGGEEGVEVGFASTGADAVIRWKIDGISQDALFAPYAPGDTYSNDIFSNSFDFENGEHNIEFTLYSYGEDSISPWEPLVQTTINFAVGPSGCTDPLSGNYNSTAVIDDGSCVANAGLDFDSQVVNTGSNQTIYIPSDIVFPEGIDFQSDVDLIGAFYLNNGNYVLGSEMLFDQNITDGSFQITIWGDDSSTPIADGFLPGQELIWALQYPETGNSLFLEPTYLQGNADNTYMSDGLFSIISFNVVNGFAGCYDELYLEYNPLAIAEDPNLCATLKVYGCISPSYMEYDPLANTDDYSCLTPVLEGCTNALYIEYDQLANTDDGSCQIEVVEGCIDILADNYDPLANTQTQIDICIYDICVELDVNNFNIEYSEVLGEIILSFDVTNTSEDKTIFAPDFEIDLLSTEIELGALNYNYPVINPTNVATVQAVITNDNLYIELDSLFELLSGIVTLTSDSVVNGLSPSANCTLSFTDEMLTTNHLGCTNSSAFNYYPEATIDNGSCVDDINAVVVSNEPTCHNDYGVAFLYLTGGIPPYSLLVDNMDSYTSYSEFGIPTEVPVTINDLGVVEFVGLEGGVYSIEVTDSLGAVFVDSITVILPPELEVIADQAPDLLLTSSVMTGEAIFYQWLFEGESVQGANSNVHYPQEIGAYQVYIEDVNGCSDYSEEIEVTAIGLQELNEYSFTIYPNPAHTSISLNLSQLNSLTLLSITDALGQELNKVILDSKSSDINYSVDISELPNGLYFLNVENNSNQIVKRFVKY